MKSQRVLRENSQVVIIETASFSTNSTASDNWYHFSGYAFDQIQIKIAGGRYMRLDNM